MKNSAKLIYLFLKKIPVLNKDNKEIEVNKDNKEK
jgi:hypothetical protein